MGEAFARSHQGVAFTYSFGGTDQLAAQIRQGARADVFAGASTIYGDQLAADHLIAPYRVFCTNRLVLVTPSSNPAGITSLRDLAAKPVKLVIGAEAVPIGSYTRSVLGNLDSPYGAGYARRVLSHVVSEEDSDTSILAKVETGEADAGFVYVTDAVSAGSKVITISLPPSAQAVASYPVSAVTASAHAAAAKRFVDFVLSPSAQRELRRAGFGPPPAT
jgi:molybdate transport system substrate-binding protein